MSFCLSLTTSQFNSFIMKNADRKIHKIKADPIEDVIPYNQLETLTQQLNQVDTSSTIKTINNLYDKTYLVDKIINQTTPLIEKRNKILENPFKYFIPFYQKKLKLIDEKLDALDLQLYSLEKDNLVNKNELKKIIIKATEDFERICNNLSYSNKTYEK